jgi:hypothetical protein
MKTVLKPQNLLEWIALKANLVPLPAGTITRVIGSKAMLSFLASGSLGQAIIMIQ